MYDDNGDYNPYQGQMSSSMIIDATNEVNKKTKGAPTPAGIIREESLKSTA